MPAWHNASTLASIDKHFVSNAVGRCWTRFDGAFLSKFISYRLNLTPTMMPTLTNSLLCSCSQPIFDRLFQYFSLLRDIPALYTCNSLVNNLHGVQKSRPFQVQISL